MGTIGTTLRQMRLQWGLSLREVRERSSALATEWDNPLYEISASWLARLEQGQHEMTIPKLISLATIYSESPEWLLRQCHPIQPKPVQREQVASSSLALAKNGTLVEQQAQPMLPDHFEPNEVPDKTTLLPLEHCPASSPYRRAMIGRHDRTLEPMIRPGSILKIDTQKRIIASHKEWTTEFDRPIYLLLTRTGYTCGWCELDKDGVWLTLVSHPSSREPCRRWKYRKEVEVIGRAVAIAAQLSS